MNAAELPANRWLLWIVWLLGASGLFYRPLYSLCQLALSDETYSYIAVILPITGWLLYSQRSQLSAVTGLSVGPAAITCAGGVLMAGLASRGTTWAPINALSLLTLSLIAIWIAGFVLFFGTRNAQVAAFPLALLLFLVPLPDFVLNKVIYWLQSGSAAIAEVIFDLSGAPVLRDGFVFRLPKYSIEVAKECSGIRSSMALLILSLLLAHFAFRPFWKKLAFVSAGLVMMLVKNGIRIATLTLLANYVNPAFLFGSLHHQGGIVFFLIGLALLAPVFWLLRRGETAKGISTRATAI